MIERLTRFPTPIRRRVQRHVDPNRRVMHIDMDAFFAAIEQVDNPHLRGRPIVVGGDHGGRGVVTTASYECRPYGVHSGMSASEARRLCPDAIFVGINAKQYIAVSRRLREIFKDYSPKVEAVSVDEAFLDLTGCADLYGGELQLARRLKDQIRAELSLTCSVGIAPSKIIAKLASSVFKPDGLTILNHADIPQVVYPLPVGKLWGVGPATEKRLHELGVVTIGDLARADSGRLRQACGIHGEVLARVARGEEASTVVGEHERPQEKSIGHEQTFESDIGDHERLHAILFSLADRVARRMRRAKLAGRTVTLKIRLSDFTTYSRRITLPLPANSASRIAHTAIGLLTEHYTSNLPLRLLGISMSRLSDHESETEDGAGNPQQELFGSSASPTRLDRPVDLVVDLIRDRWGERAILSGHGSSLTRRHRS